MKKGKFVQDAKLDPGRYYRNPLDIIRDRRLSKEERLQIVIAWEHATQKRLTSGEGAEPGAEDKLLQLQKLHQDLAHELETMGNTATRE
jgi:hypothetical protein